MHDKKRKAAKAGHYAAEAERLGRLSRRERFSELIEFPLDFTFKVIGREKSLCRRIREFLDTRGHHDVILVERQSAQKRFVSITFSMHIPSADVLDTAYCALEALPDVIYLL